MNEPIYSMLTGKCYSTWQQCQDNYPEGDGGCVLRYAWAANAWGGSLENCISIRTGGFGDTEAEATSWCNTCVQCYGGPNDSC